MKRYFRFPLIPFVNFFYLDPGSGSLVYQIILAAILGGLYFIKLKWASIINLFKKGKKSSPVKEDESKNGVDRPEIRK